MSKREAPVRFHDWCGARDRTAATRRRWRTRCIRLVAVPVSIGLAALVLAAGTLSLWAPRLIVAQTSALAVDLLDYRGDLQCRGRVGEVSYAFL